MADAPPILQVAFDTPLWQCFDYLPAAGAPLPPPGARVRAPFGRQRAVGVVVAHARESALPRARLKPVTQALDPAPLWDATFVRNGKRYGARYSLNGIHEDFRAGSGFISRPGIVHGLSLPIPGLG